MNTTSTRREHIVRHTMTQVRELFAAATADSSSDIDRGRVADRQSRIMVWAVENGIEALEALDFSMWASAVRPIRVTPAGCVEALAAFREHITR